MTIGSALRHAVPVTAAMLLGVSGASAQSWIPGVNVGAGQGGFSGSQEFVWAHTVPTGSVFLSQPMGRGFWLQPEVGYARKVGVSTTPISRLTMAADYLVFPLLVQYRWRDALPVNPFVHLGPEVTVRMRCTLELTGGGVRTKDDCDVVRGESSQKVDASLTAGAGVAWFVGRTRLSFEGRAGVGLVASAAPVDATNPRSFGWSVLLGVSRPWRPARMPTFPAAGPQMPAAPGPLTLPPLAAATIVTRDTVFVAQTVIAPTADPLAAIGPTRRVTVHAVDADVRALLIAVAREAGLDLIVSGDVRSRVSVTLDDVPAAEAIRAIIKSAGLAISGPSTMGAMAAITFYQLPINVNTASAATIAARFGTSAELANFIVESRIEKPKAP